MLFYLLDEVRYAEPNDALFKSSEIALRVDVSIDLFINMLVDRDLSVLGALERLEPNRFPLCT